MNITLYRLTKTCAEALIIFMFVMLTAGQSLAADPNAFNRLLTPAAKRNPPPSEDGIHDPAGPGAAQLQPPKEAFFDLSKGKSGNYIDWVKSLEERKK